MVKSFFEEIGGRYEQQGDYLIPCLTLSTEKETIIGVWGQRHLRYLKEYRRSTYTTSYLRGIEESHRRIHRLLQYKAASS